MKEFMPDYAPQFHCLAGDCPDTCCKDWEIILDQQTLARYRALPGEFGDAVRAALTTDSDGDTMFRLEHGHCPLLREDGLCRVQLALGEEGLCNTCHEHPRFYEEYGNTKELTLSLSCPAAARLLLEHPEPITFLSQDDGAPVPTCNDLDPELYLALRKARACAISIAQNRGLSIPERLALLLLFAARLQKLLDARAYSRLPGLCQAFSSPGRLARPLAHAKRLRAKKAAFFPCWMILNNMEHLTDEFPKLLDRAFSCKASPSFPQAFSSAFENLTVYFLWRYFLKASVDGKVLERVQSCVFHVISISALFSCAQEKTPAAFQALCALYSKEVEHSDENLALLRRVFSRGTLSLKSLLRLLSAQD